MKNHRLLVVAGLAVALLTCTQWGMAQGPGPTPPQPQAPVSVEAITNSRISYQGVLREGGAPVTGARNMTFRLYSDAACATQAGSDIVVNDVQVTNGLFSVALDVPHSQFDGKGLWLRVIVGATPIGCQEILAVPYALSLRPGADLLEEVDGRSALYVGNPSTAAHSKGLHAVTAGTESNQYAVLGVSIGDKGYGGYFSNLIGGPALMADGSLRSTAKSYLWISGNGLRKFKNADTTIIDANGDGSASLFSGATIGAKYVVLPITIAGPLYGQNVTVSGLDVYWLGDTDLNGITNIRLRRQTSANSYVDIVFDQGPDGAGYTCEDTVHPDGCTTHLNLDTNNVLTADSGILYLVFGVTFYSDTEFVRIGGVRLTLEHD